MRLSVKNSPNLLLRLHSTLVVPDELDAGETVLAMHRLLPRGLLVSDQTVPVGVIGSSQCLGAVESCAKWQFAPDSLVSLEY